LKKAGYNRYIEGLIKKGYKGNPLDYYKLHKENKMTGQEIQELIVGKSMTGYSFGKQWSRAIDKNGEFEYTDFKVVHKGKIWIEGDAICRQYETLFDGLKGCEDIYKNPEGDKKTLSEYLSLTDFWIFPFSIKE